MMGKKKSTTNPFSTFSAAANVLRHAFLQAPFIRAESPFPHLSFFFHPSSCTLQYSIQENNAYFLQTKKKKI
jgi:hypothetical protein